MNIDHPGINPKELKELSLDELQSKLSDLTERLGIAYSLNNQTLINQLHMAINSYKNVHDDKLNEMFGSEKDNSLDKIKIS